MQDKDLKIFFEPEKIALVGVSTRSTDYNLLESIKYFGHHGRYYVVNPGGGTFLGEVIYPAVEKIPESIDLAVITTPREVVPQVARECIAKGARGLVIISQGFADSDEDGKRLQSEVLQIARSAGIRIIGPNTMGVVNAFNNFSTAFVSFSIENKPIGIVSQSGIFLPGSYSLTGGLGLAVDLGNASDVNFSEIISLYGKDPRLKVISLHIEDVKDGRKFMQVAAEVSRQKPILALKTGRTEAGAKAASSHSGSLVGEDAVYTAAFKKAGVIRVKNDEELYDLSRTFATYPPLKSNRVAIITPAGGPSILAVDACAKANLKMAKLSPQTIARLKPFFPPWMEVSNPIDIWAAGMSRGYPQVLREALAATLEDQWIDAVCVITFAFPFSSNLLEIICELSTGSKKPVVVWLYGPSKWEQKRLFEKKGVLTFSSLDGAIGALGKLYHYWTFINNRPIPEYKTFPAHREEVLHLFASRRGMLPTLETYRILKAYNIPVVRSGLAQNLEEALNFASMLGYPVVMKIVSPDIIHKTDAGGVKINLSGPDALRQAYLEMFTEVRKKAHKARIEGVFLQPYIKGGLEVIIGGKQDACFGAVVIYGSGGIFTEVTRDFSLQVAPLSISDALNMVQKTKSFALFKGVRGQKPLDLEAVIETLLKVSQIMNDFPQIEEMDLNPVIVREKGVSVVDARIVLST
jgi:acetyltransferase